MSTPPRQEISPLDWKTPIVNPDGTPTLQFLRLWQQLFGNDQNTSAVASAAVPSTRTIKTTTPILGGGPLSQDLILSHAASGVVGGTYGDGTHSLTVTVDANGHITSISTNALSAGGNTGELPLVTPTSGNFVYLGNASGSLTFSPNGFAILAPSNGSTYTAMARYSGTAPSFANFTVRAKVKPFVLGQQTGGNPCGVFIRNSSNGRMLVWNNSGPAGQTWNWQRWNSDTSFNATIASGTQMTDTMYPWKQIKVTASSAQPYASPDGYNWDAGPCPAEPYSTFLTAAGGAADQVGICSATVSGAWNYTVCEHFTAA